MPGSARSSRTVTVRKKVVAVLWTAYNSRLMIIVEYTCRESPCDHRLSRKRRNDFTPFLHVTLQESLSLSLSLSFLLLFAPRNLIIAFLPCPCSAGLLRFSSSFFFLFLFYLVFCFKNRVIYYRAPDRWTVPIRSRKHAHNGHLEEDETREIPLILELLIGRQSACHGRPLDRANNRLV